MSTSYTRFIWDSEQGLHEYALPMNHPVVPPQGALVTTKFPLDGKFEIICGRVTEVAVDYTKNEIVVYLTDVGVQ